MNSWDKYSTKARTEAHPLTPGTVFDKVFSNQPPMILILQDRSVEYVLAFSMALAASDAHMQPAIIILDNASMRIPREVTPEQMLFELRTHPLEVAELCIFQPNVAVPQALRTAKKMVVAHPDCLASQSEGLRQDNLGWRPP
jgi:hypothetical protein